MRVAHEVSKGLAARGHEVTVYTTDAFDRNSRVRAHGVSADVNGVRVRRFRNVSNILAFTHHLFVSPGMVSAAREETHSFDVIHLYEYRTLQNAVMLGPARRHRIPWVVQANGSLPRIMGKSGLKRLYDALWGYRLLKEASKVIAVAMMEAGQYESMGVGRDRIEIIPNGIEPADYMPLPARGAFRRKYGIDDTEKMILYLGRIHAIKGLEQLAEAFQDLAKRVSDSRLAVVGADDGYLSSFRRLVRSLGIDGKVVFTGPLYERAKLEAYVDADVYVLPSSYEIFGVTVLEACACGTPVVVSDRCGMADAISDRAGYSVPFDDPMKLRNALLAIITDGELRARFSQGARTLARTEFEWGKQIDKLENVYAGVVRVGGG